MNKGILKIIFSLAGVLLIIGAGCASPAPATGLVSAQTSQPAPDKYIAEIPYQDGVPVKPSICPIIMCSGTDYEMGYQWAQQIIQIYGPWIFNEKAAVKYSDAEITEIKKWEAQLKQYTPEILEMCRGWADGATQAGVPMSYYNVVELWTGHTPPATELKLFGEACSGAAAWGKATRDGKLVAGASQDQDFTYQCTLVFFPKTGNNFVVTPFSVTGSITAAGVVPMVWDHFFAGHPGMNNKGVVYVHHGVGINPCDPDWGYGIRRGAAVFHNLRFCNSVDDVVKNELAYPVGDSGRGSGTAGGFYVDTTGNGCVIEARKQPVAVRKSGDYGETDFLYATNNLQCSELSACSLTQCFIREDHLGWYSLRPPKPFPIDLFLASFILKDAAARNQHFWDLFSHYVGDIDLDFMKMVWTQTHVNPLGKSAQDAKTDFQYTDNFWARGVGRASNAFISFMEPDNGDNGVYTGGIGPMSRDILKTEPGTTLPDETFTYWEIKLAGSPADVCTQAAATAQSDMAKAVSAYTDIDGCSPAQGVIAEFLSKASAEYKVGQDLMDLAAKSSGNESLYNLSRALRCFTRSQIRARQAHDAVIPPAQNPEDLGLKPFGYWK